MDEEPRESRDMQESLQEVKVELARKRLRLLQDEVTELKAQINSYKGNALMHVAIFLQAILLCSINIV